MHMAYPAKAPLSKEGVHRGYVCLGEDFGVGDLFLPGDTKDSAQVPHMEGWKFPFLMRIGRPRVAAVKQGTDDTGPVDFDFGGDDEAFVISNPLGELSQSRCGFSNAFADLCIQ